MNECINIVKKKSPDIKAKLTMIQRKCQNFVLNLLFLFAGTIGTPSSVFSVIPVGRSKRLYKTPETNQHKQNRFCFSDPRFSVQSVNSIATNLQSHKGEGKLHELENNTLNHLLAFLIKKFPFYSMVIALIFLRMGWGMVYFVFYS